MAEEENSGGINVGLVAVLVLAYAGGQWMMLTAIDTKLQALEQRIVDSAGHVQSDVSAVGAQLAMAANKGHDKEAPAAMAEGTGGAGVGEAAPAAAAPGAAAPAAAAPAAPAPKPMAPAAPAPKPMAPAAPAAPAPKPMAPAAPAPKAP